MGVRGPIPKRSDQRVRRNKAEPVTKVTQMRGAAKMLELGLDDPHPWTLEWWTAIKASSMRQFFEQTDWMVAKTALGILDREHKTGRVPGPKMDLAYKMLADLGVAEGPRRRMKIEVEPEDSAPKQSGAGYDAGYKAVLTRFGMEAV